MNPQEPIFHRVVNKVADLGCAAVFLSFVVVMLPFGLAHMVTWRVSDRRLRHRLRKAGRLLDVDDLRGKAEDDTTSVIVVEREPKGVVRCWWLPGVAFAEAPEVPPEGADFHEAGCRPRFMAWLRAEMFGDAGRACYLVGSWSEADVSLRRVAVALLRP